MTDLNPLKKIQVWYRSRIYFTHDLRVSLVEKNLRHLIFALYIVLIFGVLGLCKEFLLYSKDLSKEYFELIYYSSFAIVGLFGITFASIVLKFKKTPYAIKILPYYISELFMVFLCCYVFIVLDNIYRGLALYFCLGVVTVLCLYLKPLVYFVFLLVFNILVSPTVFEKTGWDGLFDISVLSLLLVFLLMYKQKMAKHDLLRTRMLEENRNVLQDAMAGQMKEIQEQNEEIRLQHQKIINIQNNTIISLSNLVENRDSDTGEHVRRTSAYVNLLACKVRSNGFYDDVITDDFITLLTKAAPMHDIGKIVVPDSILKKPGRLTEEEFEQIKRHTTEGGRIVREVLGEGEDLDYVQMAIEVATSHHERWDGTGYPYGIKGTDIPLSARIMSIADVFDALVSPRCYKEPFTIQQAMKIIKNEAGTHFDPVLANIFIGMEDDALAVMEKYKD